MKPIINKHEIPPIARRDKWWKFTRWFSKDYYRYLFRPPEEPYWITKWRTIGYLNTVWCRYKGHPPGVFYYTATGSEPDMTCKGCGDNLG